MQLLDVNILLYAFNTKCPEYHTVSNWLVQSIQSEEQIYIPWVTATGFLRLSTHPSVYRPAFTTMEAFKALENLAQNPNVHITDSLTDISLEDFKTLSLESGISGTLFPETYLATLALRSHSTLISADLGFARFAAMGLEWFNPLEARYIAERARNRYTTRSRVPRTITRKSNRVSK